MYSEKPNRMPCPEFEGLISDALDGLLPAALKERFEGHRAECAACAVMFAETAAGMRWLSALEEVELPADFVRNVLAETTGEVAAKADAPGLSWWQRLKAAVPKVVNPVLQPRFAMSFGMAFFSVTMLLNIAGLKLTDLRQLDLRPSALVRTYYEATGRLVKYYENIRVVYEIESRVQELKRATTPESEAPPADNKDKEPPKDRNDHSGQPDRKYQNYSQEEGRPVMARFPQGTFRPQQGSLLPVRGSYGLPQGQASTNRRLS